MISGFRKQPWSMRASDMAYPDSKIKRSSVWMWAVAALNSRSAATSNPTLSAQSPLVLSWFIGDGLASTRSVKGTFIARKARAGASNEARRLSQEPC